ncbi:hypothetical protein [Flavobacterium frigoris]|uniref:Uncharacterized protein n=1 Tax=Flavobacterium frigoris TaxID=229204 RepID=A0A1H9LJC2_FLAFI|nr:hypothetical protein [Flavobacterium frigoris]SER11601.1 hypothetical protein SAMN05444355_10754 [Flavobacterium frigoris]
MKAFYNKLIEAFGTGENKAKFTDKNIAPVEYIDLYAGQDQFEENFELFSRPSLLVDWDIDHSGDAPIATITFYCCFEQLRDTSNISLNKDLALQFLDFIDCIDEIAQTIETEKTGKLEVVSEGFNKMDSIVNIYLLTYECSYSGRKSPRGDYQEGDYDTLDLKGELTIEFDD